ncbi:hypothetical protein FRC10_010928 [Ceratobasidium sp. 414]|nr:hypothetical protein FRC10_010928 [Ceratobasidium sp. 414]
MSETVPTETTPLSHSTAQHAELPGKNGLSISACRKWLRLRAGLPSRLWATFAFVMVVSFIARVSYIFPGGFEANLTRGENYYFQIPLKKALLWTHIASLLPAGLLAVTQFIPRIRARAINFHRTAGKIVIILTIISIITAWAVVPVSFGGDLAVQSGMYTLGTMILWSTMKAWAAIQRLQIDEHRAWVIRAWSYYMSVVTLRFTMIVAMVVISLTGGFYQVIHFFSQAELIV